MIMCLAARGLCEYSHVTREKVLDSTITCEKVRQVLPPLKFLDTGYIARNTLRMYNYHLRLFFAFIWECRLTYPEVGIDEMVTFARCLQYPVRWRIEPREQGELAKGSDGNPSLCATPLQAGGKQKRARQENEGQTLILNRTCGTCLECAEGLHNLKMYTLRRSLFSLPLLAPTR